MAGGTVPSEETTEGSKDKCCPTCQAVSYRTGDTTNSPMGKESSLDHTVNGSSHTEMEICHCHPKHVSLCIAALGIRTLPESKDSLLEA